MPVFLFSDIEGSTQKWEQHAEEMGKILARHDALFQEKLTQYEGKIIKHTGDGIFALFENGNPLQCALELQKAFQEEAWGPVSELRIRIALHAGVAEKRGNDYFGSVINRTARILAAAWGGQILFTPEVERLGNLPEGSSLENLGVHLLKDLSEPQLLYGLIHPDLKLKEFPALRSLSSHPNNLPIQRTPFVGREKELQEIEVILSRPFCRLLTLLGAGGIGKTRLALQVASTLSQDFSDGVFFVQLASLADAEFIVPTVARSLGFSFYDRQDSETQLLNYLREKEMLLVLDNFEHLLDGADFVSKILGFASKIKVLVTSRERVNLQEESLFYVRGMPVPDEETSDLELYDAVQLFVQNAKKVSPDFSMSKEERRFVIRICQLVSGIPLGIELASTWVRAFSCKEIAREIEQSLDFLASTFKNMPERHRSLRAVFEHSWKLLTDKEKKMFQSLSVFCCSFSKEAALKVAGANPQDLVSFLDKSLLSRSAEGRYGFHEVIQRYAYEKLSDSQQEEKRIHDAHAEYFVQFLAGLENDLKGGKQKEALQAISEEIENVRAAWQEAVNSKSFKLISASIHPLFLFYQMRSSFDEGEKMFKIAALAMEKSGPIELLAKLLSRQAFFSIRLSHREEARQLLEKSLSLLRPLHLKGEIAFCLETLTRASMQITAQDKKVIEECLKIYEEIGDIDGMGKALIRLSTIANELGEYQEAQEYGKKALAFMKKIEDRLGMANGLGIMGIIAYNLGQYDESLRLLQESLLLAQELGDLYGEANCHEDIGYLYKVRRQPDKAKECFEKSLLISTRLGFRSLTGLSNLYLAQIHHSLGNSEKAKEEARTSLLIFHELNDGWGITTVLDFLGRIASSTSEYREAENCLRESLKVAVNTQGDQSIFRTLVSIAELFFKKENPEFAAEILAPVLGYPLKQKGTEVRAERLHAQLRERLGSDSLLAAVEKGKRRNLEDLANLLLNQPFF